MELWDSEDAEMRGADGLSVHRMLLCEKVNDVALGVQIQKEQLSDAAAELQVGA